jgi:hypothetical protein
MTIFSLQIFFQFLNRESFAALAGANLLLVQKVEKFDKDVEKFREDNDKRFDLDTENRKANMNGWLNYARLTKEEVGKIHSELDALSARLEVLAQQILDSVESAKRNTAATHAEAIEVQHKLSKKILTGPEADQLRERAATLQQQNKELRKKKAKPIFKLFLTQKNAKN